MAFSNMQEFCSGMDLDFWKDVLIDTGIDALRLFPFLLLTYIFMEYLEVHTEEKSVAWLKKAGPFGPVAGAVTGVFPQCGFSAAAANLYAAGVITVGSLLAVFLSTSDEMLPLLISNHVAMPVIVKMLSCKVVIGIIAGLVTDLTIRLFINKKTKAGSEKDAVERNTSSDDDEAEKTIQTIDTADNGHKHDHEGHHGHHDHHGHEDYHIHELCEREHCDCEKDGIFISALKHSLHILFFVVIVSFLINVFMGYIGIAGIQYVTSGWKDSFFVIVIASVIGLIPNCGVSVALTELYLGDMIGAGALMAGLLVGAGVGLLVLFRVNNSIKNSLKVTGILWCTGLFAGLMIRILGISFM